MDSLISSVSSYVSPTMYIQSCMPPYTGYHWEPFVMPPVPRNCAQAIDGNVDSNCGNDTGIGTQAHGCRGAMPRPRPGLPAQAGSLAAAPRRSRSCACAWTHTRTPASGTCCPPGTRGTATPSAGPGARPRDSWPPSHPVVHGRKAPCLAPPHPGVARTAQQSQSWQHQLRICRFLTSWRVHDPRNRTSFAQFIRARVSGCCVPVISRRGFEPSRGFPG